MQEATLEELTLPLLRSLRAAGGKTHEGSCAIPESALPGMSVEAAGVGGRVGRGIFSRGEQFNESNSLEGSWAANKASR